jgi:hypothetical protein
VNDESMTALRLAAEEPLATYGLVSEWTPDHKASR